MKERFNINISGTSFTIVSDDGAELVRKAEAAVISDVDRVLRQNKNISKLDAMAIVALDYCSERMKSEAKIRNLEAQIEILEANMHRKAEASKADDVSEALVEKPEADKPAEEPAPAAPAKEAAAENETGRDRKFRQLEELLGSQLKLDI